MQSQNLIHKPSVAGKKLYILSGGGGLLDCIFMLIDRMSRWMGHFREIFLRVYLFSNKALWVACKTKVGYPLK